MNHKFIDKDVREITIVFVDPDIKASHENITIGEIKFDFVEVELYEDYPDYIPRLLYMEVNPDFRKAGIATEMMKLAVENHGINFIRPHINAVGGSGKECHEYYTQDGKALIEACIRKKILNDDLDEQFDE